MLKDVLRERLEVIESNGLLRKLKQSTVRSSIAERKIQNDAGNELTSFSCNDYMGLSTHDVVKQAAIDAINLYGIGARASRLTTGNHPLYAEIEAKLASLYGTEAALVFSSGYTANIGSISALVGRHDMILADKFIHASSLDGARLSGATIYRFTHNNVDHCMQLISKYRELHDNCLILLENIYGVDGDLAPVDEFIQLAKEWNAWVIVDTAHGFGMLSSLQADIYVGTLSKAMGALGGFVCSSKITIEYLLNKSRSFIYTTALPPAIIAAASASIDLFKSYAEVPMRLAKEFCKIMELPVPQSHIVPLIMEDVRSVILAEQALAERGILVSAIRPPTAPTPRLRLTFTAAHKLIDVHRLCNALKACVVLTEAGNWRVL
ncbi:aminotransferase class I/II-fold pyridoxal phosphate-dependent enzyme [Anaplasma phagocytophilum]|uniref:5-aminolevulinate synthase n=3 Tax=Anaplasma phagocytophilum TaxID=948 RepID=S6G8A9_ANAPH|nr:8-amino-7-oxononanoate synthase [Anaplasma phagocytophilum]EOA62443.1 8-amino-7-oxononanoate synthase [Anaplasma phagocytophilum str. CRT38]EOA62476.1 8-amino-7-oxononanoate synthase [Anaplasma phagocytophilum str. CRT38]KDB56847.1 8-amino-7-oxononanoate synthase [Anaplasma phagocytophilum str. CRT35]KJV84059.1 aminotransferase class-V family protein [Anaplasma phagocytophilum str. CRT53-1]